MSANQAKVFLTAEWKYLTMLNFEIEPDILRPYVPAGTELDTWNGKTFVSVVGFLFLNTKVLGLAIPFHRNFEELNLRFYVRHQASEGWRRGVVFIKEIVPRFAIATVARVVYNENYVAMPMRHQLEIENHNLKNNSQVEYGWRHRGDWNFLRVRIAGESKPLVSGEEAEFITEHYWGYAAQKDGGAVEYQVDHPPWQVWQVSSAQLHCDAKAIYGEKFVDALSAKPSSAFVAEGSAIIVRRGVRL
ncbi:MAG: DUF2071 domain-containing protein [Acidobacteriota bacterium]